MRITLLCILFAWCEHALAFLGQAVSSNKCTFLLENRKVHLRNHPLSSASVGVTRIKSLVISDTSCHAHSLGHWCMVVLSLGIAMPVQAVGGFTSSELSNGGGVVREVRSESPETMDSLTRELLERTKRNQAANAEAVLQRSNLGQLPFRQLGEAPSLDRARTTTTTKVTVRDELEVKQTTDKAGGLVFGDASGAPKEASDGVSEPGSLQTRTSRSEAGLVSSSSTPINGARVEELAGQQAPENEGGRRETPQKGIGGVDFHTKAFGNEEYNNAFSASDNTNVSPKEAYETILSKMAPSSLSSFSSSPGSQKGRPWRALDLGAGAGVSTEMLWRLGYRDVVAVDWSDAAWNRWVETVPNPGVRFYALDDQRFLEEWSRGARAVSKESNSPVQAAAATSEASTNKPEESSDDEKFDAVVFNYAVNSGKAAFYAKNLLRPGGRLLAPVNRQDDYWLKQEYRVLDGDAAVVWRTGEVGAWDVVFQPDMTEESCRGVRWCPETDRRSTSTEAEFTRPQRLSYKQ